MLRNISLFIINRKYLVLSVIIIISIFFSWQIRNVRIESLFNDLLPQSHPYIKVHNEYKDQLGDPLKVFLMLTVKDGDVFTTETLEKAKRINFQLDSILGVNHNQVYSIASRKIKKITVTPEGIETQEFMEKVPRTPVEMEEFKNTVRNSGAVYGVWVSPNEKSLLFTAAFIGDMVNYTILHEKIRDLIKNESGNNHIIHAAGEPVLKAWVHHYQTEMYWIFGVTFFAIFCFLYLYFRNFAGVFVPLTSTILGAIWGAGFCGLLGYNLEPLTLVIPLLLTARALSHSVQVTERYFECYAEKGNVKEACVNAVSSILPPGVLGIVTDSLGIFLIAVAPMPIMQKMAIVCGFWASSIILTGIIFTPVFISFFKPAKNIPKIVDVTKGKTQIVLGWIAGLGYGKAGGITLAVSVVLFAISGWMSSKVDIGDINPGTPILWQDSEYNLAVAAINDSFAGTDELYIIVEGLDEKAIAGPAFMGVMDSLQRHMEKNPNVSSTLSLVDLMSPINRAIYGGYAKWEIMPNDRFQIYQLYSILTGNAAPGDFDRLVSRDEKVATVIVWHKDHMGDTIKSSIAGAKEFIKKNDSILKNNHIRIRLASGNFGMLAAVNETVQEAQLLNFVLVMGLLFILCSLTYRSMLAAVILMIPLNLANLIAVSIMRFMDIGLNINTLPVVSVGVGVGIDYGIYLLSRICEEYKVRCEYSYETISTAIRTTGKAIFFTATTMIVGVLSWYFFSSLRFQAEMGLLLAMIMFINMLGALILIPSLVYVFKPRFLGKNNFLSCQNTEPAMGFIPVAVNQK